MNGPAVVAAIDGQFVAGLIIGLFLGLLLGPILRSWLAWRKWIEASREAELTERFMARLEEEEDGTEGRPSEAERPATTPRISSRRPAAPPARRMTPDGESSPT